MFSAKSDVPTPVAFFRSAFLAKLDISNSIFTFPPNDLGFGKYSLIYTVELILSVQLLKEFL